MICTTIYGKLANIDSTGKNVETVDIEWHESFKKIHSKVTNTGREIGIRMGDEVLTRGLYEGDVIYNQDNLIIVVHTPPCDVIVIHVDPSHYKMIAKVCYEIGNRHASLFWGDDDWTFITPYNEPMLTMLRKLHGVTAVTDIQSLNFDHRISSQVHGHHH